MLFAHGIFICILQVYWHWRTSNTRLDDTKRLKLAVNRFTKLMHTVLMDYYYLARFISSSVIFPKVYFITSRLSEWTLLLQVSLFWLWLHTRFRLYVYHAEAYGNLGNSLKELGDIDGAVQFYLKAIKIKPRFADPYNNLASAYMQLGQVCHPIICTKGYLTCYRPDPASNRDLPNGVSFESNTCGCAQ